MNIIDSTFKRGFNAASDLIQATVECIKVKSKLYLGIFDCCSLLGFDGKAKETVRLFSLWFTVECNVCSEIAARPSFEAAASWTEKCITTIAPNASIVPISVVTPIAPIVPNAPIVTVLLHHMMRLKLMQS